VGKLTEVVIVGAGGFAREVVQIFKAQNDIRKSWEILGFIDDNKKLHGRMLNNYPVLGGLEWFNKRNNKEIGCVIAIGDCGIRKQIAERLEKIDIHFYNAVHPSVTFWEPVALGYDVILQAGGLLSVNTKIGNHTQLNTNVTIGHDAIIGEYCTISPRVDISGNGRLGEGVYFGCHGVLLQDVTVGSWSVIGAGAVVTENIPDSTLAVGVPARVVRKLKPGEAGQ
jgi:sugar O-acyltransferase (sialic acid O-acetyltransferase NeuD family)